MAHWLYKSILPAEDPSFSCRDVTVILPTISTDIDELRSTIHSMLACNPFQILLVTTTHHAQSHQELCKSINAVNLEVLISEITNKRVQIYTAIPRVRTHITVLADDDVRWPHTLFRWLLAPFEYSQFGGVGTCQRVRRTPGKPVHNIFDWLGAAYIERRNFEISATHWIDGGTSCMSGRTHALRTEILQDAKFLSAFTTETWKGKLLNADDDNFITRWLHENGWMTWVQYRSECEVETTLECNVTFIFQCLRWARSNWRSNLTSMADRHAWKLVIALVVLTGQLTSVQGETVDVLCSVYRNVHKLRHYYRSDPCIFVL